MGRQRCSLSWNKVGLIVGLPSGMSILRLLLFGVRHQDRVVRLEIGAADRVERVALRRMRHELFGAERQGSRQRSGSGRERSLQLLRDGAA